MTRAPEGLFLLRGAAREPVTMRVQTQQVYGGLDRWHSSQAPR